MAEFKLGRIRFVWKGDWAGGTTYYKDDVVRYGARTYICAVGHTADTDFSTDLGYSPTKWNQMTDGLSWAGDWATTTDYKIRDIVKFGGLLYIATAEHTSTTDLNTDIANWDVFAEGFEWKGNWATATTYKVGDVVAYGGVVYRANTYHSSTTFTSDSANWDTFTAGFRYRSDWAQSTDYIPYDVVKYGAGLYLTTIGHTSTSSFATDEPTKWEKIVKGFEFIGNWDVSTDYKIGDVVKYGGNQYVALQHGAGNTPSTASASWSLFTEGFDWQQNWSVNNSYRVGHVVRQGGHTYVAQQDSTSVATTATATTVTTNIITIGDTTGMAAGMAIKFTGTSFGDLSTSATYFIKTVDSGTQITITETVGGAVKVLSNATGSLTVNANWPLTNSTYWSELGTGFSWQGEWTDDNNYFIGDVVKFNSNAYICINSHRSEGDDGSTIGEAGGGADNSRPDQDVSGTYWNILNIGSETSVLTTTGDLVYYGGAGPTRLPIGVEGQVLQAGASVPEWVSLGQTDHVYYVATYGQDRAYPLSGGTIDSPWKSIRYACLQVENGPRNPNTRRLLELNRQFIQREVTEWIDYQVEYYTNTAPDVASIWYNFTYDDAKCERDTGLIVDAVVYDIAHGGNVKTRGAANAYVGGLSESETQAYPNLSAEKEQDIAAFEYMKSVVQSVLNNEAPAVNYQDTNGDNSTAKVAQYIDLNYTAEAGTYTTIAALVTIIQNALEDEDTSRIPARYAPTNLVKIGTGRYNETLPIVVPEQTAILGDELRSTNIRPSAGTTNPEDAKYSIGALGRMEAIIGDIITGNDVTETSGNTETQSRAFPYADTPQVTEVTRLVRTIQHNIDFRLGTLALNETTDPTTYNSSYLAGYGDARKNIKENKKFFQEQVKAYLDTNYASIKYSRTKCKQDVGYIVDAIVYDLTYGGNKQSIDAGLAYFDGPGGALAIDSTEKTATLAAYNYLKTIMSTAANSGTVTSNQDVVAQYDSGTAGSAGAITLIEDNMDIIYNIINGGSTAAPNITVTSITGTDTMVTGSAHGLGVGDSFTPRSTANGVTSGVKYWVTNIPSSTEFKISATLGGSNVTLTNGTGLSIVGDVVDHPLAQNGTSSTTSLIGAGEALDAQQETLVTATTNYISTNYPSLTYNVAKCERDTRLILEAVTFDLMLNSNFQTLKAAIAYLRSTASDVYDLGQKTATIAAFQNLGDTISGDAATYLNSVSPAATTVANLFELLTDVIYSGSNEGTRCASEERNTHHAILQIERNRDYIIAEIDAYIADTYSDTVTASAASGNIFTITDTSWMQRNTAIRFTGTTIGGVETDVTYYVQDVVSSTTFTVATTRYATAALTLTNASGSMGVVMYYNSALCQRDTGEYLNALKWDLYYTANHKSLYASRYYANAVTGSLEEDMFYLRDATGLRDCTLEGLTGDLLAANAYGSSRVSAGAYCSLDPGWGPEDYRAWIITRSPYIQGVTTIGTACVGQKIDGALHNGGNDSMVSNDFTQVLSDGIGAWITNNGRAELVSVFTYYNHIGYLAENGGRIRGTNGNCSYGDFGAVAEGVDSSETPNTAVVDNIFQYEALVGSVQTNDSKIFQFEYTNAGIEYTNATWTVTGGGINAEVEQDDFRDDAVHSVRLLDLGDDSSGQFGGEGFLTQTGTAQNGTTSSLTLAATDDQLTNAYNGMKIIITGGAGAGQFGIVSAYNAGSKIATVVRESDGGSGWDHMEGAVDIATPDASSVYVVEPAISFTAPTTTSATYTGMPASATWTDVVYGDTVGVYTPSYTYGGSGTSATFSVIRNGTKYSVSVATPGTGYTRLETITVAGTQLGGTSTDNDLTLTITAIDSNGGILEVDQTGYGAGGVYVAVASGSDQVAYSSNGSTWTLASLPSSGTWTSVAHGLVDDGSTIAKTSRFIAVRSGSAVAAYSDDGGATWTPTSLPASAAWSSITYGEGRWVAIASDSTTVAVTQDGEVWDIQGTLQSTGFVDIAYGKGLFIAVKPSASTGAVNKSTDGVTWTAEDLGTSATWNSVGYGANTFVIVATDSNSGYASADGEDWNAVTIGSPDGSTTAGYQNVRYGQGVFLVTAYQSGVQDYSYVAKSENGIYWTIEGVAGPANNISGYNALAFGNPDSTGTWVLIEKDSGNINTTVSTGCKAKARSFIADGKIFAVRITDPGSGYTSTPTMTITDPNNLYDPPHEVRTGSGVLAQPSFKNRGVQYTTGSAEINTGDGFADFYQNGSFIAVRRITQSPVAGSNVVFNHLPDRVFKLVSVLTLRGSNDGAYTAFFQISPEFTISEAPEHLEDVTTRIRYSQVRLTGHDFLDVGTGNLSETNYPGTPTQDPIPANETVESNGGRVFFTSTDQDGNFRVGDLFSVEQSTGVATLNADAFNISGLQEISLGEVTLGGGSATITEFSTDPFFTADSDSIIPTQRAIKAYIASQIGGGGASLNVNSVTAGSIQINSNQITTTGVGSIQMNARFNFTGGVTGAPLAFNYFLV